MEYDDGVAAMSVSLHPVFGYEQVATVGAMTSVVTDNTSESRYEIKVDDAIAGIVEYRLHDDHITFTHAEVDDAHEGEGLGSTLARQVLDSAREAGLAVFPACPFIAEYIKRHPDDYLDLVPENRREKFGL